MNFTLRILGTASAMPVPDRFPSAHVLDVRGRSLLIDCGEGAQYSLVRYRVPLLRIDSIFISHIHGDHVYGLFGLLSSMSLNGRKAPLSIYGPQAVAGLLNFFRSYYGPAISFDLEFTPVKVKEPAVIHSTKSIEVLAFPLDHGIETYGYMVREKTPPLNVKKDEIERLSLSLEEIGTLKRGDDVVRESGVLPNKDLTYIPYNPRSYAYCSDTAVFPELPEWVRGVDLLYHESTYLSESEAYAAKWHHSTAAQAARVALDAGAGKLILGHYSSRNQDKLLYQAEAREIFPESYAADDGDVFDIPYVRLGE